jgi:hypothetical protein
MKNRVTIRMGANKFEALVNYEDRVTVFDLNALGKKGEREFRKELVIAWRESTQIEDSLY